MNAATVIESPRSNLDVALEYSGRGLCLLPIEHRGKDPVTALVPHGKDNATTDAAMIRAWWSRVPNAGIGISLHPSDLVVVDVDPRNDGVASLANLVSELGPLPRTVTALTGGGGWHYLLRAPKVETQCKIAPGVELLANGYIVVAPSIHPSGNAYAWRAGQGPGEIEIADLPATWLERFRRRETPPAPVVRIPENERDQVLKRASAYLEKVPGAVSGSGGHNQTFVTALHMVKGFNLDESDAYRLLASEYNERCSPPWSERDLRRKVSEAAKSSVASGYLLNDPTHISYREPPRNDRHPNAPIDIPGRTIVDAVATPKGRRGRALSEGANAIAEFSKTPRMETGIATIDEAVVWLATTIAVLIGPTGRGKTSLALQIARHHAATNGPVLFVSAELVYVALCGRATSQLTSSPWIDVLDGREDRQAIENALNVPDFVVLDEVDDRWLDDVESWLTHWRAEQPGRVPLVVVDYLQIMPGGGTDDRQRVGGVMQMLIKIAKRHNAAVLAISKTARGPSKALRAGELVGDDTTEAGAESNAIEYGATVQISLGKKIESENGETIIEASISKNRYRQGDLVVPLEVDLAHGWFRPAGDARSGTEVRKERATVRKAEALEQLRQRVATLVRSRPEGFESRNAIYRELKGNKDTVLRVVADMLEAGDLETRGGRIVVKESR